MTKFGGNRSGHVEAISLGSVARRRKKKKKKKKKETSKIQYPAGYSGRVKKERKKSQESNKLGGIPPNLTRNAVPFARARAKLGGMWKRRLIGTGYAYFNVVSHPATVHAQFEIFLK